MAAKSILTPVRVKIESPNGNRVLGTIPRRVQLVDIYPSQSVNYARSPSCLQAIRPERKLKRKPCAEAGIFPIRPTIPKKPGASITTPGRSDSKGDHLLKATGSKRLSTSSKTPKFCPAASKHNWYSLRSRLGAPEAHQGHPSVSSKTSMLLSAASTSSKNSKRKSLSARSSRFKSRIPVRVTLMDPKIIEDLEKEEQELLARLAVVRDKLRKARAQGAVRRPGTPNRTINQIVLPMAKFILPNKTEIVNDCETEPNSPVVGHYFSPVVLSKKRRSRSLHGSPIPSSLLASPSLNFRFNVLPPSGNNSAMGTDCTTAASALTTTPTSAKGMLDDPSPADNSVVKLGNVPEDELLDRERADSPTAIYGHLRRQISILNTPDHGNKSLLRRRNSDEGGRIDLRQVAQLNSVSKRVQAQLASLFAKD